MRVAWIALAQQQARAPVDESFVNSPLFFLIVGVVVLGVGFLLYTSLREKPEEPSAREIAESRQQGVLTLQFVFTPASWQAVADRLPAEGEGIDAVIGLGRELRETRHDWVYVAARGTILMGEDEAAAETRRVLDIFQTRASNTDVQGPGTMLLTVVVRAPSDYCELMPGDVEGFEMALAQLFEVDSRGSCSFQLQWTEVVHDTLPDVVPGVISVSA